MTRIGIVSLGCPRNLVDSEIMLGSLKEEGFCLSDGVGDGVDVFIVNTCSFVESARKESVDTILEAAQLKKEGKIKYLVVAGCLPQHYGKKLLKSLPEVDAVVGTSDIIKIVGVVKNFSLPVLKKQSAVSKDLDYLYDENSPRFSLTPPHFAYVKVSEGCDNRCSYCIISRLRGKFRSRSIDSVIKEINNISVSGALREINLIGQDTTFFGRDRYGKSAFPELLRKIAALDNSVRWVRILYTHPAHYTGEFIATVRDEGKICKYLDLPVQHISDNILKRMNRSTTKKEIAGLIKNIRRQIPGVAIRTSVIVGFPGETEKDFRELLSFLKEARFERLGAFVYSKEDLSRASKFKGQVPEKVKTERFDEIMKLQQDVSADINRSLMGKTVEVLIDEKIEEGNDIPLRSNSFGGLSAETLAKADKFLGRTEGDAPEVDGSVYVSGKDLKVGEFYKVKITDTLEYDLVGQTE